MSSQPLGRARPGPDLLERLSGLPSPALLESSALHQSFGRYTMLACRPLEVLTLRDGVLHDQQGNVLARDDRQLWEALSAAMSPAGGQAYEGYAPGWIGYLGYELGRHIERLPGKARRDTPLPDLRLAFYDSLLVYDALTGDCQLLEARFADPPPGAGQSAAMLRAIAAAGDDRAESPPPAADAADASPSPAAEAQPNFAPCQYQQAVQRCVDYIAAGDIFQVNLSQRLVVNDAPQPLDIYRALRLRNPSWHGAWLSFDTPGGPCAILSSSPELFLRVGGRQVVTRPIKGTRPRVGDPPRDLAAAGDLWESPKDNAELAMIIDLLRNDLGRVCRFGSVKVPERRRLEAHPTVYHLVGTVQGELREGVGPAELLRATFPGGSITGAPKIRAMEIIDELEPTARGVYTGCIGIVGVNGRCEWNIAIRTIVWCGGRAYVQAGGAIVADSSPEGEYLETLAKARAMLEALAQAQAARPPAGNCGIMQP